MEPDQLTTSPVTRPASPPRPESTRSIEGIADAFRGEGYIAERSLATTVFLALELGRPLLLEGEAGVGKTELAKVLATTLGSRLIRLQCYEGLDVNTAVYEWNYPRQMLEIRLLEARGEIDKASAHDIFGPEFLLKRPLLQALESTDGNAPVLLIDEIDRADEEFEAYLLEILSDFQVTVPEIGTIRAAQAPRVVLTSNRTREVHDALKRRCLYHWIDYPTAAKEFEIVSTRVPEAPAQLAREVVGFVHRLRAADLTKVPGVAETLDWAAALLSLGARRAVAGRRRRDAGRGPQVRGGHPAGSRNRGAPVPRRGDRPGLTRETTDGGDTGISTQPIGHPMGAARGRLVARRRTPGHPCSGGVRAHGAVHQRRRTVRVWRPGPACAGHAPGDRAPARGRESCSRATVRRAW